MKKITILLLCLLFLFFNSILAYGANGGPPPMIFINNAIKYDKAGLYISIERANSCCIAEVDYNPSQLTISDVVNMSKSTLFSFTDNHTGKLMIYGSGSTNIIDDNNRYSLWFIPITLKSTNIPINIQINNYGFIHNITFQCGKILNDGTTNITINDAIAGLQYLAGLRSFGSENGQINVINMASISNSNNPSIKDITILTKYLVGLKDENMNMISQ